MTARVIRRLFWLPFLLMIVSFVTFLLGYYGPGDPVEVRLGNKATPESVERLREEMGLNRPVLIQYGDFISKSLKGDFGESYSYSHLSVNQLIWKKIWVSVQLGTAAIILSIGFGIPLGLLTALKHGTLVDTIIMGSALFLYSMPVFIAAPFLILLLALNLQLLPTSGWEGFFSLHLIMPALVMGLPGIAGILRLTRASALEVLSEDYVRTARAKGLSEVAVQWRHVLRNALLPIVSVLGLSLATLVEGAFITETIFGIPGIGRLGVEAVFQRDYPVIIALVLIIATTFALANLLVDILYGFLDPRIRV